MTNSTTAPSRVDSTSESARRNIAKETVTELDDAPIPAPGIILQVRTGKVKKNALGGEITSAIYKQIRDGPVFCTETGLVGDEHVYHIHGGYDRAVHQYDPNHYAEWRSENPPKPGLYDLGGFGENLSATNMSEDNVCIGDVYKVGEDVVLKVREPRHPCYKLNSRFEWPRALKRTLKSGRPGWNYGVLKTGHIAKGNTITLVERPLPKWSIANVQRVIRGKVVPISLVAECAALPMTDLWLDLAKRRLREAPKTYTLVKARYVTPRVRKLMFALKEPIPISQPEFDPYAFAQIKFGPDLGISRSYSIVEGTLQEFSLGVALDDQSRGGSAYLHNHLKIGDSIEMSPGANPKAVENDKTCEEEGSEAERTVIIGGIGVTAFMPSIRDWEAKGLPYHVHYAVRSPEEAAFLDEIHANKVTLYAKSKNERLNINQVIPPLQSDSTCPARIFSCGPSRMMKACEHRAAELGYPEHMVHFEDFSAAGGDDLGPEFEVEVDEPDADRHETLKVPSDQSLLDVLNDAGFDVLFSCKNGGCGACKVTLCSGKVDFQSTVLKAEEKKSAMQSCVDRGVGKIRIEID
ncbi:hypothetical protein PRZ48_006986 [Zasmidium cellare]|uniref:Uncharacterized protein n=1 Tax=Zasmidium cellare TaxID=395010 RepID=A0ABR0EJ46_ZASCE|nr:hypothetical protein PRZ48_006986 [Zasmidium cellare]